MIVIFAKQLKVGDMVFDGLVGVLHLVLQEPQPVLRSRIENLSTKISIKVLKPNSAVGFLIFSSDSLAKVIRHL